MIWHAREEREVIKKHGGKPLTKYGYDGIINGRPVEVRSIKKDDRYRIQKDVHKHLVRNDGAYIFVNERGASKRVPAKVVSEKIGAGKWYKDRNYPHKFIKKGEVWG